MSKFYSLKYDCVFKNVFFRNEELLKKLLMSILREYQEEIEIKNIREEINKLNADEDFYQYMTDKEDEEKLRNSFYVEGKEVGKVEGKAEGKVEGIEEGIMKTNINNAKKMKEENISESVIQGVTGLDINAIKKF